MLLIGTKRMFGRPTASQIASASATSFLFAFTYGFTNCGAHQPYGVPEALERTARVVGTRARFHACTARRGTAAGSPKIGPFAPGAAACPVPPSPVHRLHAPEKRFRQIDTDGRNIHGGRSHPR
jgi:hypothetical protein